VADKDQDQEQDHEKPATYRAARQKSNPLGKLRYLWNCSNFFPPNLQRLQRTETSYSTGVHW